MLQVENFTRGVTLVEHGRVANTHWARLVGLIGVRQMVPGDGLAIVPCRSVHCFFMSMPIDVLYVNREHRVVAMDHELRPWRIGSLHKGVHYVVELPAGTLARTGTAVGDQLRVAAEVLAS
ncbi:MAG: DUF192 domain-containing protein [Chloroflexi bacterium]|nr:DUF192 domain-containing protein [Chloroflexota bacterium]